jgi:hypothetical protein
MEKFRNCPSCNEKITYSSISNFKRSEKKQALCKKCANKKKWKDTDSKKKASDSRKKYLSTLSDTKKQVINEKTSKTNKLIYKNKTEEEKNRWRKICSVTSMERWKNPDYKESVKKIMIEKNWSKREDSKEIKNRQVTTRIKNNGGTYHKGPGRCQEFEVNGIICYGRCEKKFIEILVESSQDLPTKPGSSIQTEFGSYTPDFEFDDFYVDVKSPFTYGVLLGELSYSKNRKSNPKQLKKIYWVSDNIKKIKIAIVDGEIFKYVEL